MLMLFILFINTKNVIINENKTHHLIVFDFFYILYLPVFFVMLLLDVNIYLSSTKHLE